MSETPSERPRSRRSRSQSVQDGETGRAKRRRRKKRPSESAAASAGVIQIVESPEDEKTLVEVLKEEARTGVPGLLVSAGIHAIILIIMALIVVTARLGDESPLTMGWIPNQKKSIDAKESVAKPVRIKSIRIQQNKKPAKKKTPKKAEGDDVIKRIVKPVDVQRSLVARSEELRRGALEKTGKQDTIERALKSGLGWVVRQQRTAGNWKLDTGYPDAGVAPVFRTDTGATALALLALLGDGNTPFEGQHKDAVARGLKWLKSIQKVNGDFLDDDELGRQVAFYVHSQATIAICEAYAMTQDREYRESAEKAIQFLIESQHPTQGGWRYQPQDEDSMGDLSVTSWALMALHSARMAKIEVPAEAFGNASRFIDSVQAKDQGFIQGSIYKYLPSDGLGAHSPAMTAAGLLARQWMGWRKDDIAMEDGVRYLLSEKYKPEWGSKRNVYEWYYVAQTLHNIGGQQWKDWFNLVQALLVENQVRRGSRKAPTDILGSWHPSRPPGAHQEYADKAGRLYLTTMCLLILETPYRHYPIYGGSPNK